MPPNNKIETELQALGYRYIAGVDEAGRGAWAGPIVAAAVILPPGCLLPGVRDSKLLTSKQREKLFPQITAIALDWAVSFLSQKQIDRLGIQLANRTVIQRAIAKLKKHRPHYVLVDHYRFPDWPILHRGITHGDRLVTTIAAASIIAKVSRDRWMAKQDKLYLQYGFGQHKGYGTKYHQKILARIGPCTLHRRSYQPIKTILSAVDGQV